MAKALQLEFVTNWDRVHNKMARTPAPRAFQVSCSHDGYTYVWGGRSGKDGSKYVERFDRFLEKWDRLETKGIPHPGTIFAGCTSYEQFMYLSGGHNIDSGRATDVISCLNLEKREWKQLHAEADNDGPSEKIGLGMTYFDGRKLVMVGGYGRRNARLQTDGSLSFIEDKDNTDHGWTNAILIFHIREGKL